MSVADTIAELLQQDIQTAIEQVLCVEAGSAQVITLCIFKQLQKHWGGKEIYIPAQAACNRHEAIREVFNGRNHSQVCKEFNISLSHLYRVIR
jgi:Mor family transcriptional regulator